LIKEDENGEVIVNDVEAAEVFNKYFGSVFTLKVLLSNSSNPTKHF